ncbi:MAG: sensor histidine kinase [Bellilinea sp.]
MSLTSARNRWTAIDTVAYLMIGSVAGRMLPYYLDTAHRWIVIGGLALFLALFTVARQISYRQPVVLYPYFILQLIITLFLGLVIPSYEGPQDYFAMLVLPLCVQAMWRLPQKTATGWVTVFAFCVLAGMIIYYQKYEGSWEGIGYGMSYVAACVLISVFSTVTRRAQEAREESQALNAELQAANRKLQEYALQVEQLAAAEERSRLARDLHDSVSQTIFSLTLTAQAARILLDRDPGRVAGQLDHLQSLAKSALGEMRSLIQQLRPDPLMLDGLAACLRQHVRERKEQDDLEVDLTIQGERRLPAAVEEGLFRVVQEALNNVVRHAGVNAASVTLRLDQNPIELCIEDRGKGFNPQGKSPDTGHLGLAGMAERVRSLGARLEIDSAPGSGTRVWVRDLMVEEIEHA